MHLWPSLRIRDSFKHSYLSKIEWNLHRMKQHRDKPSSSSSDQSKTPLLSDDHRPAPPSKLTALCGLSQELIFILSCCFCCFCCGACQDEEEK